MKRRDPGEDNIDEAAEDQDHSQETARTQDQELVRTQDTEQERREQEQKTAPNRTQVSRELGSLPTD